LILSVAASADLVASIVTGLWVAAGFFEGLLFAILFAVGSAMFLVASVRQGRRAIIAGIVLTVIAEYEPIGGVIASSIVHQNAGAGALAPLAGGFLSIVAGAIVLLRANSAQKARRA